MKKLIFFVLVTLAFTACKKNSDPEPDAATVVSGTYVMTLVGTNDGAGYTEITLPQTGISGTVTATRKDAATVTLSAFLKIMGQADQDVTFGDVTLQKSGATYNMLDGTTKIGTIDGTNFEIDGTDTSGDRLRIKGKK